MIISWQMRMGAARNTRTGKNARTLRVKGRCKQKCGKFFIEYDDKSRITLTGKQKDISLRLATKYHREYVNGRRCKAIYQQYPKKNHAAMDLFDKIEKLEQEVSE